MHRPIRSKWLGENSLAFFPRVIRGNVRENFLIDSRLMR